MKLLDLFSGIGGFSYGLERIGFKTVAFCEMDKYCKLVLQKHWKGVKIYNDVKELKGEEIIKEHGTIDIVVGGFPCQPFSIAGARKGTDDNRHLWPEMFRIIKELKPRWVIGENVRGIVNIQNGVVLRQVQDDLEKEGFEVQCGIIPASGIGAWHQRKRVWIIAYANSEGEPNGSQHEQRLVADSDNRYWSRKNKGVLGKQSGEASDRFTGSSEDVADSIGEPRRSRTIHRESDDQRRRSSEARRESVQPKDGEAQPNHTATCRKDVADTESPRMERRQELRGVDSFGTRSVEQPQRCFNDAKPAVWGAEPRVGRVADGVPNRTHRLKGLGNAVVPGVVAEIGRVIMHFHENGIDPRG